MATKRLSNQPKNEGIPDWGQSQLGPTEHYVREWVQTGYHKTIWQKWDAANLLNLNRFSFCLYVDIHDCSLLKGGLSIVDLGTLITHPLFLAHPNIIQNLIEAQTIKLNRWAFPPIAFVWMNPEDYLVSTILLVGNRIQSLADIDNYILQEKRKANRV